MICSCPIIIFINIFQVFIKFSLSSLVFVKSVSVFSVLVHSTTRMKHIISSSFIRFLSIFISVIFIIFSFFFETMLLFVIGLMNKFQWFFSKVGLFSRFSFMSINVLSVRINYFSFPIVLFDSIT